LTSGGKETVIPYGHQSVDHDDVDAVLEVLRGDWLTQGPRVGQFEADLVAATGARFAVAFCNGTAALHAACAAAGLGPGDTVATSTLSFVASANCARYVGAEPVLVDVDPETMNLDPALVPSTVDALVAVHYAGLPLDLSSLPVRPAVVIEDAAHALGATTPDGPVGNCAHSEMTCFSFHPVKVITTGEGGAVTTNDAGLAERLRSFRNHGMHRDPARGGWYYDVTELGYNFRLTDLQAALGSSQLRRLEPFILRRNALADRYRTLLGGTGVGLPPAATAGWRHAYHLFPLLVPDRRRVFDALRAAGIGVQVHYTPIHRLSLHRRDPGGFPGAERLAGHLLSIPIYPDLTDDQQDLVVAAVLDAL